MPAHDEGRSRHFTSVLVLACLAALVFACYGDALVRDGQFSLRDAAHYYYPLHQRVQHEWSAGRVPLWDPQENAGAPLLGNPTAAVLYPGKVVFAIFAYPTAVRLYTVGHTLLAFTAMFALARHWGISRVGSSLAGLSYAFGAPTLFLHCNIIYLVGAAWMPLGLRAVDRWVREGRRVAVIELAVVLALQVLGGEPEAAYLEMVCAGGYALSLGASRSRRRDTIDRSRALSADGESQKGTLPHEPESASGSPPWQGGVGEGTSVVWLGLSLLSLFVAWLLAAWLIAPHVSAAAMRSYQPYLLIAWGGAAAIWFWRASDRSATPARLLGLAGAAVLALGLSSAQTVPVAESIARSVRSANSEASGMYAYDLEPVQAAEAIWPQILGSFERGDLYWFQMMPPAFGHGNWVPSLYMGGLGLVLALGAIGLRGGPPWRAWLSAIAVVSLLGALGKFTSPHYWLNRTAAASPVMAEATGDGSVYWLLATVLPGFSAFRFPGKLIGLTTLAFAAFAGLGWDRLQAGVRRRFFLIAAVFLIVSLAGLLVPRDRILAVLESFPNRTSRLFGPLDLPGCIGMIRTALCHGAIAQACGLVAMMLAGRYPRSAGATALVVLTLDLALANAPLIVTIPQADFDREPEALRVLRDAERANPAPGSFRIYTMPPWSPIGWSRSGGADRHRAWINRERDLLQPKFGLDYGVSYAWGSQGDIEAFDYWLFYRQSVRRLDAMGAQTIGAQPGQPIFHQARRGFDLWGTRYFIVPVYAAEWKDPARAYATFLDASEMIYPDPAQFEGPEGPKRLQTWLDRQDVQIRRNTAAFPRAWIVHEVRAVKPVEGQPEAERKRLMDRLLFANDPLWHDPDRPVADLRRMAFIETSEPEAFRAYRGVEEPSRTAESVAIVRDNPQRVELTATLRTPGLVILSDSFAPGWHLTIDGQPAEIHRANRMMRGAVVPPGTHMLVYLYEPRSFRVGAALSCVALIAMVVYGVRARRGFASSHPNA
jgi:hypothetical protein